MEISSRQLELDQIFDRFAGKTVSTPLFVETDRGEWPQADKELCAKISGSKQGERFQKLFAGQFEDYGSQSEADLGFCNILSFWCGKDGKQMDRIFRQSKLFRPKWDEKHGQLTYGLMTIQKAIAGTDKTYEGTTSTEDANEGWFPKALANASASRFIDHAPPELDWVFNGSLLAKTVGALVGPGGVGKSTLLLLMLIALATGRAVLPGIFKPTRPGKVLAIFAEEDETILHHRFKGLVDELFLFDDEANQLLKENMLLIAAAGHDLRMLATSYTGEIATAFFSVVFECVKNIPNLRLVAVDPLSRFFGAEENNNGAGTFFVSMLEQIAQATGAAVIVSHHVGKRSALSGGEFDLDAAMHQDSARGASAITNGVRWQCNLVGLPAKPANKHLHVKDAKPGQFLALQVSKKNYGPPEPVHFLERQQGGVLRPYEVAASRDELELDSVILKLAMTVINDSEQPNGKRFTKKSLKDFYSKKWKEGKDNRITGAAFARTINNALLSGEIHEVRAKNKSGKAADYLTLHPPVEPEIEPEAFKPEEPETTGKNEPPVLN
jgi:RecA-family ATPase